MNKFLLAGDKFMPEMHLRQPGFMYSELWRIDQLLPIVLADHLLKTKKEYKDLKKLEIRDMFIKAN